MTGLRFVAAMAWRESRASGRRLLLLTAAISIGVGALVAIESFTQNLRVAVEQQSRALLGGDVNISPRGIPSDTLRRAVDSLLRSAGGDPAKDLAEVTGFSGMAYVPSSSGARLVQVSAIAGDYPFYGAVHTLPEGAWSRLRDGRYTLVDPSFLTALGAGIGDTMALGNSRFVIAGSVTSFPGDVGIRSAFGPRVFIPAAYLAETGLLTFGSRSERDWYLRTPANTDMRTLADGWRKRIPNAQARIQTAAEEEQDLKEFLDQLGRYLGLVALVALLLGGIGVGSAIQVFLRRKRDGIAVLRCLGATSGQIFAIYLAQALVMGLAGSGLGVILGVLLQLLLPTVFGIFLPLDVVIRPSAAAIFTGLGVGVWVATVFALLPLLDVRRVPPLAVLRRDVDTTPRRADGWTWLARLVLALSVVALAGLQVGSALQGLAFAAGVGGALLMLWLAALGLTRGLRRWFPRGLPYVQRQGLANLYRPANQTVAVVLALGFGAFLLGALAVMQHTLLRQLSLDGGLGRPNLVFFDIQPEQRAGVAALIDSAGFPTQPPVPIVPMRLKAINGKLTSAIIAAADSARPDTTIARGGPRGPRGRSGAQAGPERWALRREFRSTYRDTVVGSEKIVVGDWWNPRRLDDSAARPLAPDGVIPISLETSIASDLDVTLRDTLTWDVQGVAVRTVITSLREVNWARFEPNFYAVFPTGVLEEAPQMFVLLTRADSAAAIGRLQRSVVERYPNVTSIDLTAVQQTIEKIVGSVSLAIRFMAFFSLGTGVVVLIGALATSRFQRIREAALLKTLGATRRQVVSVMVTEYAALGVLSATVAVVLAGIGGWAITKWVFKIPFSIPWAGFGMLAAGMVLLTVLTGLWNSLDVFSRPPIGVLREE